MEAELTAAAVPGQPSPPPFEGDDTPAVVAPVKAADAGDKGGKPKDEGAVFRTRIEQLERENQEIKASERYWAGRAQGAPAEGGKGRKPAVEDPEVELGDLGEEEAPEGDAPTPEAFLDALTAKGIEPIIAELNRRGLLISKQDVVKLSAEGTRRIVAHERGKMTIDAQLARDFPELKDDASPLFQETAKIFRQNVELDPNLRKSPAALLMAAHQAKAELAAKAPPKKAAVRDYREIDDDDEAGESTDARRKRINAQRGELGRESGAPFEGDEDSLGPEAREVVQLMGVDERAYRARRAKIRRAA
jgi:hypothetical protein